VGDNRDEKTEQAKKPKKSRFSKAFFAVRGFTVLRQLPASLLLFTMMPVSFFAGFTPTAGLSKKRTIPCGESGQLSAWWRFSRPAG
jgi:hypothetical protein